jgi:hypothetical protein
MLDKKPNHFSLALPDQDTSGVGDSDDDDTGGGGQ